MDRIKLFKSLILLTTWIAALTFAACGREGTVYGTLNDTYVELNDSVSAYSTLYDAYSGSYGYAQSAYGSGTIDTNSDLIIAVGDGSEGFVVQIYVADIYQITCGYSEALGYNINMEVIMENGDRFIATSGQILFDTCGVYNGERTSGYFQAYFTSGELFGDFQTNIGY
jgi:hypothetical protein